MRLFLISCLYNMHKHIPLLLIGATLLTLASCGKTPEPVVTQSGSTGSIYPTYTREQLENMSAESTKTPFSVNSGTTSEITSYLQG